MAELTRPTASQLRLLADVAAGYVYLDGVANVVYLNDPVVGVIRHAVLGERVALVEGAGWVEPAPPWRVGGTRRKYRLTDEGRAVREHARAELRAGAA
jgi:hypothetical protein